MVVNSRKLTLLKWVVTLNFTVVIFRVHKKNNIETEHTVMDHYSNSGSSLTLQY